MWGLLKFVGSWACVALVVGVVFTASTKPGPSEPLNFGAFEDNGRYICEKNNVVVTVTFDDENKTVATSLRAFENPKYFLVENGWTERSFIQAVDGVPWTFKYSKISKQLTIGTLGADGDVSMYVFKCR